MARSWRAGIGNRPHRRRDNYVGRQAERESSTGRSAAALAATLFSALAACLVRDAPGVIHARADGLRHRVRLWELRRALLLANVRTFASSGPRAPASISNQTWVVPSCTPHRVVSRSTISNPLPAVRERVGLAQLVLKAAAGIDDLAAQVTAVELQPQPDRALPVHDGIGHQLADDHAEIVEKR